MTESRFFTPVEFEQDPDPSSQKSKTTVIWHAVKLTEAFRQIEEEIGRIKAGTSVYTSRPIDPGRYGTPAFNAIKVFVANPSDKVFEGIEQIATQDWGSNAAKHFRALLYAAREVKINE